MIVTLREGTTEQPATPPTPKAHISCNTQPPQCYFIVQDSASHAKYALQNNRHFWPYCSRTHCAALVPSLLDLSSVKAAGIWLDYTEDKKSSMMSLRVRTGQTVKAGATLKFSWKKRPQINTLNSCCGGAAVKKWPKTLKFIYMTSNANISIKQAEEDIQEIVWSNTSMLASGMTLYMHDEQHFTHKHMTVFKLPF